MSNNWKAKCIKGNYDWQFGEIIEVVNGVALEGEYHGWGGSTNECVQSFKNWCEYHNETEWELLESIETLEINEPTEQPDAINPSHYNSTKISAFDVIDDWKLNFYSGNVVKYIQRAGKKENNSELQDLKKAQRYLEKQIELLEGK